MASQADASSPEEYEKIHALLGRGDIVGVTGTFFLDQYLISSKGLPGKSKKGELSIFPSKIQLLSPCLRTLPKSNYGFKDVESRYRMRYLDLIMNNNVREKFVTRFVSPTFDFDKTELKLFTIFAASWTSLVSLKLRPP